LREAFGPRRCGQSWLSGEGKHPPPPRRADRSVPIARLTDQMAALRVRQFSANICPRLIYSYTYIYTHTYICMYILINEDSFSTRFGLAIKIKQIETVFASSVNCREPPKRKSDKMMQKQWFWSPALLWRSRGGGGTVWIPTLKENKTQKINQKVVARPLNLCSTFLFLLLLPESSGGRGPLSSRGSRPNLPSPHGVGQVSAPAPPPVKSRRCGAGPRGEGGSRPAGPYWDNQRGCVRGVSPKGVPGVSPPRPGEGLVRISRGGPILGGLSSRETAKGQGQHGSGNPLFSCRYKPLKPLQMRVKFHLSAAKLYEIPF